MSGRNASKNKGDAAEREVAKELADRLGLPVRRKLGAGRADDEGDLEGVPDWTFEVKNYANLADGISEGLSDLEREQVNAGTTFGACLVRRRGGRWIAVMDLDGLATVVRETLA